MQEAKQPSVLVAIDEGSRNEKENATFKDEKTSKERMFRNKKNENFRRLKMKKKCYVRATSKVKAKFRKWRRLRNKQ